MNGEAPHPSNIVRSIDDFYPDGSEVGDPAELAAGWPKLTREQIDLLRPLWNQPRKDESPGCGGRGSQYVSRPAMTNEDGLDAA